MTYRYFNNCVNWDRRDVHCDGGLCDLVDECETITRDEFLKHVHLPDLWELEDALGYDRDPECGGLTMADDWHVTYFRSKLHGETVYGFKHSAIEYVFLEKTE